MIIYDLSCDNDHRFEGWFRSADEFDAQQHSRLVTCPQCESHIIRRLPSAIAISSHRGESGAEIKAAPRASAPGTAVMPAGSQVLSMYRQLVQSMINNSEDVGNSFAEEARKIHYNQAPERPIRGDATEEECEELRDEGIPILRLPAISEEDLN